MKFLAALLSIAAGPAFALSCVAPSGQSSFAEAAASPMSYSVLLGEFAFDEAVLANGDGSDNAPEPQRLIAAFSGKGLTPEGFREITDQKIALQQVCAGPWCGRIAPNEQALVFVQNTPAGGVLSLEPCSIWVLPPSEAETVAACFIDGGC